MAADTSRGTDIFGNPLSDDCERCSASIREGARMCSQCWDQHRREQITPKANVKSVSSKPDPIYTNPFAPKERFVCPKCGQTAASYDGAWCKPCLKSEPKEPWHGGEPVKKVWGWFVSALVALITLFIMFFGSQGEVMTPGGPQYIQDYPSD